MWGDIMADELIGKRLTELALRAYNNNYYTYTDFLGLAELGVLNELIKNGKAISSKVYLSGGARGCERVIAAFGNEESFGYKPEFPISCIEIKPVNAKYADRLTHRDYLGSILNLGIEREVIGDIIVKEDTGYVFCHNKIADYIVSGLERIKHTVVSLKITDEVPDVMGDAVDISIQVSSERIDAMIAKLYKMSRGDAVSLIKGRKVYVNGVLCESNSYSPKEEDMISVRGFGRFKSLGVVNTTKKGNSVVRILKW